MITKNIYKIISSFMIMLLCMTACEESGDKIYLTGLESSELIATSNKIVLSQDNSSELVLSLAWTKSTLSVTDSSVSAPDVLSTYIEISTDENFSSNVIESLETNLSKAYTGSQLNTLAKNIGAEPEVATTFYFRLKGSIGKNIEPVYSNIVAVDITSYRIDMSIAKILDKDQKETETVLYSAEEDGIYSGFLGATGWYNFYLQEGTGLTWGNLGEDGAEFQMSSDASSHWNFWFPEAGGCYYVIANTNSKLWSGLYLPSLTVSGDIQGEMTFDRPNVRWIYTFTASEAKTYNIKLQTVGKQYDASTKTDATLAQDTPLAFVQNGSETAIGNTAQNISVEVKAAGECTLVLNLKNPRQWTCDIQSGSVAPTEVNPHIYLPGVDDLIRGGWTFDTKLNLYDEDNLSYAGVVNVNSEWGYGICTEVDNWNDFYKTDTGEAMGGILVEKGPNNLPAPAPGLYLINTSLKGLTYSLAEIGNKIYVSGLNDVWDFSVELSASATIGVYQGQIKIEKASGWGFKIYTEADWTHVFGGSGGKLTYLSDGITDDASLAAGVYTLTVDLVNATYNITQ